MRALEDSLHYAHSKLSSSLIIFRSPSHTSASMTWQCVCDSLAPEQLMWLTLWSFYYLSRSPYFLIVQVKCFDFFYEVFYFLFRWFPWLHYFLPFLIGNHKFILLWDSSTHLFVIWSIKGLFLKLKCKQTQFYFGLGGEKSTHTAI